MSSVHVNESELLTQAFLKGAGLPPEALANLTPEVMELIGALLAASVQGTIDLLALRSLVKQEAKSDVTVVVMRNNNPLKFFPDSETVLTQMLRKKMPGFMEPLEAMEDARRDLRAHQMAVVAGTRASVGSMLHRLHPERIEAGLGAPSLLDKLLASRRKAAAWSRYQRKYQTAHRDVADDAKGVFGPTFREAYENEVQRIEREKA